MCIIYVLYMYYICIIHVLYVYIICIIDVLLATDLGRYIRKSAVRTPPPCLHLLTDWLSSWLLRCFKSIFFYWLLLTGWLFTDWLTFWPKQKGYIARRLARTATEVHNDHFLLTGWLFTDWLTFWLNKLATSEDGLARTATEVHNDNFADQYFSWSAFSWSAFS